MGNAIMSIGLQDINAEMDLQTACMPGYDGFELRLASTFYNNPQIDLRSPSGLVAVVMLDTDYLTAIRFGSRPWRR